MNSVSCARSSRNVWTPSALVEERLDAGFIVVGFVLVGAVTRGSPAPDADDGRLLEG